MTDVDREDHDLRSPHPDTEPMIFIATGDAPAPNGHYSQAVVRAGMVFISTQLPFRLDQDQAEIGFTVQIERVLSSLLAITEAAGGDVSSIAKVTLYLKDIANWQAADAAFAAFMGSHKPARGVLEVSNLKNGWAVAADAFALI